MPLAPWPLPGGERGEVRVVILGTGAMACLLGARLARSGRAAVTLAGTWREALETMAARGITVEEEGARWIAPVATASIIAPLGPADLVLVLVKSHRTASVAPAAARAVREGGLVLSLQNGLGNREVLEEAVGAGRVAGGVLTLGATLLGPGHVRAHAGHVTLGGEPTTAAAVQAAADLLRGAGFVIDVKDDLDRVLWSKLAVNCAINPLTALRGVVNGELLESGPDRGRLVEAAREVGAVAAARCIDLGVDPAELALEVARKTAANRSSMLQDLDRGAPTEIDALCGAVVREGLRLGVPTPVNEALWREVSSLRDAGGDIHSPPPTWGGIGWGVDE